MHSSGTRRIRVRRTWQVLAAPLVALCLVLLGSGIAHAATLKVTYDVSGTTRVATTGSTIGLGPSTLDVALDSATGGFTGSMRLPATHTTFRAVGLVPMSADVAFEEAAPVTGTLSAKPDGTGSQVQATATYYIRLSNIRVVGFPTFTGPSCRTKVPVSIPVSTPAGESFAVFTGGRLSGSYVIGAFQNCGLNTWLVNALVPGGGNTVDLDLSHPRPTP